MKKHLLLVLMIVLMSGMFRANYSFIEFDIGTVRVTIDQWGGLFWDPLPDVFDDLVEDI